jgi:hypothetical protein
MDYPNPQISLPPFFVQATTFPVPSDSSPMWLQVKKGHLGELV